MVKLDTRMKTFYEETSKTKLVRRMPVAIRIDGRAFSTFTRRMNKPFDEILTTAMQKTTEYLCKNIQGCVFGYTQSDEITLILVDYENLNSSAWFDYEVQKLCSISASMATFMFNKVFFELACKYTDLNNYDSDGHWLGSDDYWKTLQKNIHNGAMFDARCFNIPKEEVTNLVYWRQKDARRNAVSMIGRTIYTPKELHGVTTEELIEMLGKRGINVETDYKHCNLYGTACIKNEEGKWTLDYNMPMLLGEDRNYLDRFVLVGDTEK